METIPEQNRDTAISTYTAQEMKFNIKDFFIFM